MKHILFTLITFACTFNSFSQNDQARTEHFNIKKAVAISGFDPVSYFDRKALKGSEELAFTHQGVTYYFSSKENLDRFKIDPKKYEPQYGGWCAYAIGDNGAKVKIDPNTFKIVDGKLYLFYNFLGTNTLDLWNENELDLLNQADKNWTKVLREN